MNIYVNPLFQLLVVLKKGLKVTEQHANKNTPRKCHKKRVKLTNHSKSTHGMSWGHNRHDNCHILNRANHLSWNCQWNLFKFDLVEMLRNLFVCLLCLMYFRVTGGGFQVWTYNTHISFNYICRKTIFGAFKAYYRNYMDIYIYIITSGIKLHNVQYICIFKACVTALLSWICSMLPVVNPKKKTNEIRQVKKTKSQTRPTCCTFSYMLWEKVPPVLVIIISSHKRKWWLTHL